MAAVVTYKKVGFQNDCVILHSKKSYYGSLALYFGNGSIRNYQVLAFMQWQLITTMQVNVSVV